MGHFHLTSGDNQLNVSLISGYNCAIYCGTSEIDGKNDALMRERFGRKRIKIEPIDLFMARAAKSIHAHRYCVRDIIYRNAASYSEEFPGIERLIEITGRGDLTLAALNKINKEFFRIFYDYGQIPGLYVKPEIYSVELERRLVFETTQDIRMKPIVFEDKTLLDYVTFLGE